jgi:2-keto-3-deoxy-L-rhamnonate aldolase RhmA
MNDKKLGIGTWISIGNPIVTELTANLGFDWLLFDLEHGFMGESGLLANIQAVHCPNTKVIVRIDEARSSLIGHALDYGAAGIMAPHVSNADTAKSILQSMYFPPRGDRGVSTSTRSFSYGANVPEDITLISPILIAQIEDYEGVMNADEIASVDGVDVVFIGPRDLRHDLSTRPKEATIDFQDALVKVADAARNNNKQAGILVRDLGEIHKLKKTGYSALAAGSDLGALKSGYSQFLSYLEI